MLKAIADFAFVVLVFFVLPMSLLSIYYHWRAGGVRRRLLATTIRMGDAEFLAALSPPIDDECAKVARDMRTLLAKCCLLPRQCVRPESILGEIFFASGRSPHGVDIVDIVCRMEDLTWHGKVAKRLDEIRAPGDDETVAAFIGRVIDVYRSASGDDNE